MPSEYSLLNVIFFVIVMIMIVVTGDHDDRGALRVLPPGCDCDQGVFLVLLPGYDGACGDHHDNDHGDQGAGCPPSTPSWM